MLYYKRVINMKRKITKALEYWKTNESHMPYMLIGARQVGKTYIIEEFCKNNYKDFIYILNSLKF